MTEGGVLTEQALKLDNIPIIDISDVKKVYKVGSVEINALRGVSLTVQPGELCCIVGRSGSGKSTLLNLLAGLEPATSGKLTVAGCRLDRMNEAQLIVFRQEHVGFVFQSFNLMPYYTALENVAFPLSFRGIQNAKRIKRAKEVLTAVGLETHLKHKPSQMSGGQQQRVGIARALVANPDIVFADEPTGNLDSTTSDDVMHMITDIIRREGKTLIMVTHDPNVAAFADTVISLLDGHIVDIKRQSNT